MMAQALDLKRKVELLVAGTMAGDYVIAVRAAPSYGDERKFLVQLLEELPIRDKGYFIADTFMV